MKGISGPTGLTFLPLTRYSPFSFASVSAAGPWHTAAHTLPCAAAELPMHSIRTTFQCKFICSALPWSFVRRKHAYSKRTFLANFSMMGVISCTPSAMTPNSTHQYLRKCERAPCCHLSWDVHVLQSRWAACSEGCHWLRIPCEKLHSKLSVHRDMTATLATVCHAP